MLGLLGLRIFEACGANISDLGEEHGHRVLRVRGKGSKIVLVPLPPAVARALDRAIDGRDGGPILRNTLGVRMDRHAATRRLKHLADTAGIRMPRMHPHMLRYTLVNTMLDAGVSLRDVQIAARHADPRTTMRYDPARKNLDRHPRTTSSPRTWPPGRSGGRRANCREDGPHTTDIPMPDIVDVMLEINADTNLFEAGNVRHEHDWRRSRGPGWSRWSKASRSRQSGSGAADLVSRRPDLPATEADGVGVKGRYAPMHTRSGSGPGLRCHRQASNLNG